MGWYFIQLHHNRREYSNLFSRRGDYELSPKFVHHYQLLSHITGFEEATDGNYFSVGANIDQYLIPMEPLVVYTPEFGTLELLDNYLTLFND